MFVIGLTGGIGTGKTQVSRLLEELGASIVNADLLGHEVYAPQSEGWHAVVNAFGEQIVSDNGEIDRRALGGIVFSDDSALQQLNAIMHPRIYDLADQRLKGLTEQGVTTAVLEAALLIEAKWTPLVDDVWVTVSPEEDIIARLQERNNMDEATARSRIDSQMPQTERVEHADVIVENNASLEDLSDSVKELWNSRVLTR
ncbi:MAG: dephospho-CoA kinase [Chloroflexi bacterium]|nr:dephospho-CoA kinase [Chloroflexota bacterium]